MHIFFPCPFTLLYLLPTSHHFGRLLLRGLPFLFLFLKSSLANHSLAKFYCGSCFFVSNKIIQPGLIIKGIGVYYTLSTRQSLLHWNQLQQLFITYIFDFKVKCFMKTSEKKHPFHNKHLYIWATDILKFYIPPCMHKTIPTLGNEKEQQQIKFYEKLSGELIFSRTIKNLKMFYFTHPAGRVLKK